ncbi:hypothetical protein AAE02nite_48310 [Adhaeribacter aerolatus]|uniref:Uncharacterized protein n=1 Tax=Adhaeribacter aerolatus TaxID=670289 RepID=A0A512B5W2_9BACT|nr:hypothetical protein AAE02nite_48310 [Adhaeribacter aerolatus]
MRSYDLKGINAFEEPKDTIIDFDGIKVKFGAGFTQSFQGLKHKIKEGSLSIITMEFFINHNF